MGHIGAEGGQIGQIAGRFATVEGTVGLGRVLHHQQVVSLCDGIDGVHLGRLAHQVYRHDGPGQGGDGGFDLVGVDVEGFPLDIDKYRGESGMHNRIAGCHEGERRDNDLVTPFGPEIVQHCQRQDIGIGAAADGNRFPDPDKGRKTILKLPHQSAAGDAFCIQRFGNQTLGSVGDSNGAEGDGSFLHDFNLQTVFA